MNGSIDYAGFDAVTFDCYGTLIDWEAGLVGAADLARSNARRRRRRSGSRSARSARSTPLHRRGLGMVREGQRSTRVASKEYRSGR